MSLPEPPPAEPVFVEPWEAQIFALAVELGRRQAFAASEWAVALGAELRAAPNDDRYYEAWLSAVEKLVIAKGLADPAALAERKAAWARAYRSTPHGRPVQLATGYS